MTELKGAMSQENVHCGYEITYLICQNSSLATLISPSCTERQNSQHPTQGAKKGKTIIDNHEKFKHVQGAC